MGDVVLYAEELQTSCAVSHCRICHEAEFENDNPLEAPCACSGTVKFAHRDCIQRWCNEKGNTICEICLQNYEPGYTAPTVPSKKTELSEEWTIRDSLEIVRREDERNGEELVEGIGMNNNVYSECTPVVADRGASCCKSLALTFTVVLLLRHSFATLADGNEDYPFSLFTILVFKISGIVLPMYIVFRIIGAIQEGIHRGYQVSDDEEEDNSNSDRDEEEEQEHLV